MGKAIDAGLAAGANRIEGLSFGLKREQPSRTLALEAAVRDAQSKAEVIAHALGERLGRVTEVTEEGAFVRPPRPMVMERTITAATPVEPGEIRLQASVTVQYELLRSGNARVSSGAGAK